MKTNGPERNQPVDLVDAAGHRKLLKKQVLKGAVWTSLQNLGGRLMGTAFFFFLGRLLMPEDFGLVAAASVFLALSDMLMEQGLGQALIQRKDLRPEHCDTVFWVQVVASGLVCAMGQILAPWLAGLYQRPELAPIIRAILLVTPLTALSAVHQALLSRELGFKQLALRNIGANLAGGLTGVALAFLGAGAWSLVAQQLVAALAGCVLLWTASLWRPGRAVHMGALRELMGFSIHLFFQRGFLLIKNRADQFLIGYVLGPVALGFYSVAFRLIDTITNLFIAPFSQLSLPVFSRLQSSDEDMRKAYDYSVRAASLLGIPASVGLLVLAPEIIELLLGPKWSEAVPLTQALALMIAFRSIATANSAVLLAKGRSLLRLQISGGFVIFTFLLYVVFVRQGTWWLCVTFTACSFLLLPINAWMIHRLIGYDWKDYLRALGGPVVASGAMLVVVLGMRVLVDGLPSLPLRIGLEVVLGACVYLLVLWPISESFRRLATEAAQRLISRLQIRAT